LPDALAASCTYLTFASFSLAASKSRSSLACSILRRSTEPFATSLADCAITSSVRGLSTISFSKGLFRVPVSVSPARLSALPVGNLPGGVTSDFITCPRRPATGCVSSKRASSCSCLLVSSPRTSARFSLSAANLSSMAATFSPNAMISSVRRMLRVANAARRPKAFVFSYTFSLPRVVST